MEAKSCHQKNATNTCWEFEHLLQYRRILKTLSAIETGNHVYNTRRNAIVVDSSAYHTGDAHFLQMTSHRTTLATLAVMRRYHVESGDSRFWMILHASSRKQASKQAMIKIRFSISHTMRPRVIVDYRRFPARLFQKSFR